MSFKPIDAKRDEYRKYLERTGAMDMLCKVVMKLFECPEMPENAIDFIRSNIGDSMLERDTIENLKRELEDSRNEVAQLKRQLEAFKLENTAKVADIEPAVSEDVKDESIEEEVGVVEESLPSSPRREENVEKCSTVVEPSTTGETQASEGRKDTADDKVVGDEPSNEESLNVSGDGLDVGDKSETNDQIPGEEEEKKAAVAESKTATAADSNAE